jgi:hypothetical protein
MDDRVILRSFSYRAEAELVRELLASGGIEAFVNSDDCGSVDPALQFGRGAEVLVSARDHAEAEHLIAVSVADALEHDDDRNPAVGEEVP